MSREHAVVARLTRELATLRPALTGPALRDDQAAALRRVLYGLYALVQTHFGNEEEVYLPLLEAGLTPAEAGGACSPPWRSPPGGRERTRRAGRLMEHLSDDAGPSASDAAHSRR